MQKHFEATFVTTTTNHTWIACMLQLSNDFSSLVLYNHEKGSVAGYITSMDPIEFIHLYDTVDDEDGEAVLLFGDKEVYKSELRFLKKMVLDALEFWEP